MKIRKIIRNKVYEEIVNSRIRSLNEGDIKSYDAPSFSFGECDLSQFDPKFMEFITMWFSNEAIRNKAKRNKERARKELIKTMASNSDVDFSSKDLDALFDSDVDRQWLPDNFFGSLLNVSTFFLNPLLPPTRAICNALVDLSKSFSRAQREIENALIQNASLDRQRKIEREKVEAEKQSLIKQKMQSKNLDDRKFAASGDSDSSSSIDNLDSQGVDDSGGPSKSRRGSSSRDRKTKGVFHLRRVLEDNEAISNYLTNNFWAEDKFSSLNMLDKLIAATSFKSSNYFDKRNSSRINALHSKIDKKIVSLEKNASGSADYTQFVNRLQNKTIDFFENRNQDMQNYFIRTLRLSRAEELFGNNHQVLASILIDSLKKIKSAFPKT